MLHVITPKYFFFFQAWHFLVNISSVSNFIFVSSEKSPVQVQHVCVLITLNDLGHSGLWFLKRAKWDMDLYIKK